MMGGIGDASPKVGFASDSPLEEAGFATIGAGQRTFASGTTFL
jgi:hypothetical protein